jgi:hypothetical protein
MAIETKLITVVKIDWTTAQKVRMTARKDLPEYGLKAGDVFYLVRSSKADTTNEYYIVRWNYSNWQCPCKSRKPCRHITIVSADCHARIQARKEKQQKAIISRPSAMMPVKDTNTAVLNGNRPLQRPGPNASEAERELAARGLMRGSYRKAS